MTVNSQSSDKFKPADNPNVGNDIYGGEATIDDLGSIGGTGFVGNTSIDLATLNLDLIIPDIDVWYYYDVSVGGGISQRSYVKLPYTELTSSLTVEKHAYFNISFQYDDTKGTIPLTGTTFLTIYLYDRTSSSGNRNFIYKIKSSRVQTIGDSVPF